MAHEKSIYIKGARVHNLKNIEVEIPHEKLVVVTGLSGSGKSTLAFDTIFAEGQRRYVESLSSYTESGKLFYSENYVLLRDRDYLFLKRREESKEDQSYTLHQEICQIEDGFEVSRNPELACLDADTVKEPLVLRRWQSGDKFVPFGMKGKKKVSDYLTDRKFSLFQKENQYVVCSADRIVWLVGERSDDRFRVTEDTKRVLIIRQLEDK